MLTFLFAGEKGAWNTVKKLHNLRHIVAPIIRYGCLENVSGNSGELAHKPLLKQASKATTGKLRKQIAEGIATFNARRASLLMLDAQERSLEGEGDDEDCEDTDADYADDAEKETYSCVLAAKYPLLESTVDRSAMHMRVEAPGRRSEGRQKINLNTCRFDQVTA